MPINKIKLMDGKTTIHDAHGDITFNELLVELIDYYENHLTLNGYYRIFSRLASLNYFCYFVATI